MIDYVKHKRGINGLNEFFTMVNEGRNSHDNINEDILVPKNWYSYELYLTFLNAADMVTGNGDLSKCYDIGFQTLQNLGHLSYLTRAPTVPDFVKMAVDNWNNVYDFGTTEYEMVNDNKLIFRYYGFPKDKAKCEYFRGSLAGMLSLCGLVGTVVETKCNTEDSDHCEYTVTWE